MTMGTKVWQLGSPGSWLYALYDGLRVGVNRKLVNYLLAGAVTSDGCKVLEAGSGPAFASSILNADRRVALSIAMDIDMEALLEARLRDPSLALVVADLQHLPFKKESIDLAWNSSTIEHLPSPEAALAEMQRVTRPGGKVFVGVPNLYGPLGFQHWIQNTSVGIWIGTTFNRSQLQKMVKECGLQPLDSIFYFFRFFVGVLARK